MTASDARLAEIQALIEYAKSRLSSGITEFGPTVIDRFIQELESVPAQLSAARADGWDEGAKAAFDYEEAIRRGTAENFMAPNPYRSQEQ